MMETHLAVDAATLSGGRPFSRPALIRPREVAFWLYVGLVAAGAWLTIVQQDVLLHISPSGFGLSWLLLVLYLVPAAALISYLDIVRKQPLSMLAGALLWGAVAATAVAARGNVGWGLVVARLGGPDFAAQWSAAVTAPLVEETAKVVGVVLLAMIAADEFRDPLDGFVYGALVGLAFAVVEDVLYFVAIFGGTPSDVVHGFGVRVLSSGLYGHALWTGMSGLGVGYFISMRRQWTTGRRLIVAGSLLLVAMAGHFLWDSPLLNFSAGSQGNAWLILVAESTLKGLPFLAFGVILVVLARRRERRQLVAVLSREAIHSTIRPEEVPTLRSAAARRRARRTVRSRAGRPAAAALRRLQRQQLHLAAVLERFGEDAEPTLRQRAVSDRLRRRFAALEGEATQGIDPHQPLTAAR
jgi:protease PrsW